MLMQLCKILLNMLQLCSVLIHFILSKKLANVQMIAGAKEQDVVVKEDVLTDQNI
jgi:hypothetical protein